MPLDHAGEEETQGTRDAVLGGAAGVQDDVALGGDLQYRLPLAFLPVEQLPPAIGGGLTPLEP